MKLALIVAAATNNVIGKDNQLPWHLPQDLKYFKAMTLGKPIIMGRKTYESIGKPLPGRTNIVVTRQPDWAADGVLTAHNLDQALVLAGQTTGQDTSLRTEAMVIGGAEIFQVSLPRADRIYLTRIKKDFAGDAHFPEMNMNEWKEISAVEGDAESSEPHTYLIFDRVV